MRRSSFVVVAAALALVLAACAEQAAKPVAALSSSPHPRASVPRGEAMERGAAPSPCPSRRSVWGGSSKMCGTDDQEGVASGEYYVPVVAKGLRFRPGSFVVSLSGQIEFENVDNVVHNITVPASGISLDVEVGAEDFTRPITLEPGRYEFFCRFHKAEGMRGVFSMTGSKDLIVVRRGY